MLKPLTQPLLDISILPFFEKRFVDIQVQAETERIQTEGLSRDQYLDLLFGQASSYALPVGHLMDHRVRMPLDKAKAALLAGPASVVPLLDRMLLMTPNSQSRQAVGRVLDRDPQLDADLLCTIHAAYPAFAELCLSGRLGDFSRGVAVPNGDQFLDPVTMMACYYGALDCQQVGLRPRELEGFRLGLDTGSETATMGQHAEDTLQQFDALKRIRNYLRTGSWGPGTMPDLIRSLEPVAKRELATLRLLYPHLTDDGILDEVQLLFSTSEPEIAAGERAFRKLRLRLATRKQPLRCRSSTVVEGQTAAFQVAYATGRLLSLVDGVRSAIRHPSGRARTLWEKCFSRFPDRQDERWSILYRIYMEELRKDPFVPLHPALANSQPSPLTGIPCDEDGRTPSEDLFKEVIRSSKGWHPRSSVATKLALTGSARFDVLPCFRFSPSWRDPQWTFVPVPSPVAQLKRL
jgi:hypothetical protein